MELKNWPRIVIPITLFPSDMSDEETKAAILSLCEHLWKQGKIPVVGWEGALYGLELHPVWH